MSCKGAGAIGPFSSINRPGFSDLLMFRFCLIYTFLTPLCCLFCDSQGFCTPSKANICFFACLMFKFKLAMISAGLILVFNEKFAVFKFVYYNKVFHISLLISLFISTYFESLFQL